eukprot:m.21089 g.21089  ORF g.21089 m.21089 type:complete len:853 (+) comp5324_c0_seq1:34-2592(+)
MSQVVRKAAHALAEEGDLMSLYADLKDVAHSFDSRVKSQERACKSSISWSVKEKKVLEDFMLGVTNAETKMLNADRNYNEEYRLFGRIWKSILGEKKELNSKMNAFKKATKNLEQARKKYNTADTKQPRDDDKLTKARKSLESMEVSCAEVEQAMKDKLLEVQAQKHITLRTGYLSLYKAAMIRLRVYVEQNNVLRQLTNQLPEVVGMDYENDEFEYKESTDTEERPLWTRGEEMMAELVKLRDTYDKKIADISKEHSTKVKQLVRERDSSEALQSESYSAEVLAMVQKNSETLDALEREHTFAMDGLMATKQAMEKKLKENIALLEGNIRALQLKLEAKHKQMKQHAEESTRLEDTIEALKHSVIHRATNQAKEEISSIIPLLSRSCHSNFHACIQQVRSKLQELFSMGDDVQVYAEYDDLSSSFAHAVATLVHITYTLSKSSKAENSSLLLEKVEHLSQLSSNYFEMKHKKESSRKRPTFGRRLTSQAMDEKQQKFVALYNHQGKEHGGSVLIGFKKGDKLILLKKRDDGWCKVSKGAEQGWAPFSYLKLVENDDNDSNDEHGSSGDEAGESEESFALNEKEFVEQIFACMDDLTSVAKEIIERDQELAALSNALVQGLEGKVTAAQQSVIDTKAHVTRMFKESKERDNGRRLEVNTELLQQVDKLTGLMTALIKSGDAMREAMQRTKGMQTQDEYNVKHGSWLQGLNNAVDAMVEHNPVLSEALRAVVRQQGKHEELQVSARNLSASVAQFAALSRSKSFPDCENVLSELNHQSEEFKQTTHEILARSRECKELDLASVMLEDFANLSENDAKRLVMATQVNVLKLESNLNKEHEKLRRLRRLVNYEEN